MPPNTVIPWTPHVAHTHTSSSLLFVAGMNVIMPTAMITMHEDEELSAGSARTAKRGIRILRTLKDYPAVVNNAKAILAVATDSEDKDEGLDASLMEVSCNQKNL